MSRITEESDRTNIRPTRFSRTSSVHSTASNVSSVQSSLEDAISYVDSVETDQFTSYSIQRSVIGSERSLNFCGKRQRQKIGTVLCAYISETKGKWVVEHVLERFLSVRGLNVVHCSLKPKTPNYFKATLSKIDPDELNAVIFIFRERKSSKQQKVFSDMHFKNFLRKLVRTCIVVIRLAAKRKSPIKQFRNIPNGLPADSEWILYAAKNFSEQTRFKNRLWIRIEHSCTPRLDNRDSRLGLPSRDAYEKTYSVIVPRASLLNAFEQWKRIKVHHDGTIEVGRKLEDLSVRDTALSNSRIMPQNLGSQMTKKNNTRRLVPRHRFVPQSVQSCDSYRSLSSSFEFHLDQNSSLDTSNLFLHSRVFCLVAPRGMGKSIFVKHVAMFPKDLGAYVRFGANAEMKSIVGHISAQLCVNLPEFRYKLQSVLHHEKHGDLLGFSAENDFLPCISPNDDRSLEELLMMYVVVPAKRLHPNTNRKLIYLDGLDALEITECKVFVKLLNTCLAIKAPWWLRVFCATAPVGDILPFLNQFKVFILQPSDDSNIADLERVSTYRLGSIIKDKGDLKLVVDKYLKLSNNWPLYLSQLLNETLSAGVQGDSSIEVADLLNPSHIQELKVAVENSINTLGYFEAKLRKFKATCLDLSLSFSEICSIVLAARSPIPIPIFRSVLKQVLSLEQQRSLNSILSFHNMAVDFLHQCFRTFLFKLKPEHDLFVDVKIGHELLSAFCVENLRVDSVLGSINTQAELDHMKRFFDLKESDQIIDEEEEALPVTVLRRRNSLKTVNLGKLKKRNSFHRSMNRTDVLLESITLSRVLNSSSQLLPVQQAKKVEPVEFTPVVSTGYDQHLISLLKSSKSTLPILRKKKRKYVAAKKQGSSPAGKVTMGASGEFFESVRPHSPNKEMRQLSMISRDSFPRKKESAVISIQEASALDSAQRTVMQKFGPELGLDTNELANVKNQLTLERGRKDLRNLNTLEEVVESDVEQPPILQGVERKVGVASEHKGSVGSDFSGGFHNDISEMQRSLIFNIAEYGETQFIYHLINSSNLPNHNLEKRAMSILFNLSWLADRVASSNSHKFFTIVLNDIEEFSGMLSINKTAEISKERQRLRYKRELLRLASSLRLSMRILRKRPEELRSQLLGRLEINLADSSRYLVRLSKALGGAALPQIEVPRIDDDTTAEFKLQQYQFWWKPVTYNLCAGNRELTSIFSFTQQLSSQTMSAFLSLDFHPFREICAIGCFSSAVLVVDLKASTLLYPPLIGHTKPVCSVSFSQDGGYLCSSGYDGAICLFNILSGELIRKICTTESIAWKVTFVEQSFQRILSCFQDGTIRAYYLSKTTDNENESIVEGEAFGEDVYEPEFYQLSVEEDVIVHEKNGIGAFHVLDNTEIIFACDDNMIYKYRDSDSGFVFLHQFSGHCSSIRDLALNHKQTLLLSAGDEENILLWDLSLNVRVKSFINIGQKVTYSIIFAPSCKSFFAASSSVVREFDLYSGAICRKFEAHSSYNLCLAVKSSSEAFSFGGVSQDAMVRVWTPLEEEKREKVLAPPLITDTSISLSQQFAVVTRIGGQFSVYSPESGKMLYSQTVPNAFDITKLAISRNDSFLAVGLKVPLSAVESARGQLSGLCLVDLKTGTIIKSLPTGGRSIKCCAFSSNSKFLAYYSLDSALRVFDVSQGCPELMRTFDFGAGIVQGIAWHPTLPLFVSICKHDKAVVFQLLRKQTLNLGRSYGANDMPTVEEFEEGNQLHFADSREAKTVAFSPSGHQVVIATEKWIDIYSCEPSKRSSRSNGRVVIRLFRSLVASSILDHCRVSFSATEDSIVVLSRRKKGNAYSYHTNTINSESGEFIRHLCGDYRVTCSKVQELELCSFPEQSNGLTLLPILVDDSTKNYVLPGGSSSIGFSVDAAPTHVQAFLALDGVCTRPSIFVVETNNLHIFERRPLIDLS
eukprot:snap_masked-scaffold_55-processed-gene-0.19-mRNA-1 protein AED:1.00 eAED:1.00 QI:0/-1/0/0/-1/1/1/0/1941